MKKLALAIFAALAGPAAAGQAVLQLPGYDGGAAEPLPVPAAALMPADDSASPTASFDFLVRPEAAHEPGARLYSPDRQTESAAKAVSGPSDTIPYFNLAKAEAEAQGMDVALVLAVIQKESSFDPKARSAAGAVGLMQLLPDTARWLGLRDTSQLTKPAVNIKYGVKYLKFLWDEFATVPSSDISQAQLRERTSRMAIAAYNAGQGNVRKYNDVPPFKETKNYVARVTEYFAQFEELLAEALS